MKYALIGCGRIAVNHMKAAINNKLEIVAVCDVLPEKMEALLEKYDLQNDPSIKRYTDYKQMLAENDITLASIATESGIHAQIALYCIDHGVNVIIEKPMAMSMDDAEEIVRIIKNDIAPEEIMVIRTVVLTSSTVLLATLEEGTRNSSVHAAVSM